MRKKFAWPASASYFIILIGAVYFCLLPGVTGGFLFDDYPNLEGLGTYGGVNDWGTFKAYILGGFSGPSGRPLSLLSFLLDDNTWPSNPYSFKHTNILLHLLGFCLLALLNLQLFRLFLFEELRAQRLAVLSAAVWALHPFMVSTTLYVVQRMAQLSSVFVLLGITGYLYGRRQLEVHPRPGLLWMATSLIFGTVLATLSKENGILLVPLVLAIEFCLPARLTTLPRWFSILFLWLPSFVLCVWLLTYLDFSPNPWPNRNFNQLERVMTESRVVFDYLSNLILPRIEGVGLYRDGLQVSKGLFNPITTFFSIFGLFFILVFACYKKNKIPLFSLAVLFFFVSHLLESTWLALELYFEHRNYLAAMLLPIPVIVGLDSIRRHQFVFLCRGGAFLIIVLLASMTYTRATLWGDTDKLEVYWALAATDSPRAQSALASQLWQHGKSEEALAHIDSASTRLGNSSLLTINRLYIRASLQVAQANDFSVAATRLVEQSFDPQAIKALRNLVDKVLAPSSPAYYRAETYRLIEYLENHAAYNKFPLFVRLIPYLKAQLLLADGKIDKAELFYSEAIELYGSIDSAMQMVAEVANAGYLRPALRLLDVAEKLHSREDRRTLKFDQAIYQREIDRIRLTINEELKIRHE